jgi:hypothetical protein
MGHFDEEALKQFQAMCAEGVDFGEGPVYDYAMCVKPDGEIYGVPAGDQCRGGKPISDKQGAQIKSGASKSKLSKLKAAFLKKTGRNMTPEEQKKAKWMKK